MNTEPTEGLRPLRDFTRSELEQLIVKIVHHTYGYADMDGAFLSPFIRDDMAEFISEELRDVGLCPPHVISIPEGEHEDEKFFGMTSTKETA